MYSNNLLLQMSLNNAKNKSFRKEYGLGIIITGLVRFLSAGVSIYAGYYYFENLLTPISGGSVLIPIILAVLLLATIEFFSAWLLSKLTKSTLEKRYQRSAILAVFAVFTFAASFVASTNGLAMRQSQKVDNTQEIVALSKTEIENINAKYDVTISELKDQITAEKENPQGWRGGRRVYLTAQQLDRISGINKEIQTQREAQKLEIFNIKEVQSATLSDNRQTMTETADKYWKFIAIVMLISALSNIAMQIFYMKILHEEALEEATKGSQERVTQDLNELVRTATDSQFKEQFYKHETAIIMNNSGMVHKIAASNEKNTPERIEKKAISPLGFKKNTEENEESEEKEYEDEKKNTNRNMPFSVVREHVEFIAQNTKNTGICEHCNKEYVKRTTWQKYCSELCRASNYEETTGKKMYLKKKK